jgi:hypothetical protein
MYVLSSLYFCPLWVHLCITKSFRAHEIPALFVQTKVAEKTINSVQLETRCVLYRKGLN